MEHRQLGRDETTPHIRAGDESPRQYVHYECMRATFRPNAGHRVRWLDWESDYDLASTIWPEEFPLELETWQEARQLGYHYCAVVERQHVE